MRWDVYQGRDDKWRWKICDAQTGRTLGMMAGPGEESREAVLARVEILQRMAAASPEMAAASPEMAAPRGCLSQDICWLAIWVGAALAMMAGIWWVLAP